jgi:hypothetical protein
MEKKTEYHLSEHSGESEKDSSRLNPLIWDALVAQ